MNQKEIERLLKDQVNAPHQFSWENGVILEQVELGRAQGRLNVGENSGNPHGMVHGGALVTLADTVAGTCACSRGNTCVTTNSSMEYLRPGTGPWIKCLATAKKIGRSLSVVGVDLTDSKGQLIACGSYTFYMMEEGDQRLQTEKTDHGVDKTVK